MSHSKFHDVIHLTQLLSEHIHTEGVTHDYYINAFQDYGRIWDVIEMEHPVKEIQYFLPYSRLSYKFKKNFFFKAERANQADLISHILADYLYSKHNSNSLFYLNEPTTQINLQYITINGHKNPLLDEQYLLKKPLSFPVINIITENYNIYIDLCATQIDINHYDDKGHPFLLLDHISLNEPYAETYSTDVIIKSIDNPIPINDHQTFANYQKKLENDQIDEDVILYNEYLYNQYRLMIKKKIKNNKKNKRK